MKRASPPSTVIPKRPWTSSSSATAGPEGGKFTIKEAYAGLDRVMITGRRVRAPLLHEVPTYCGLFPDGISRNHLVIAPCPRDERGNLGEFALAVTLMGAERAAKVIPTDLELGDHHRLLVAFR